MPRAFRTALPLAALLCLGGATLTLAAEDADEEQAEAVLAFGEAIFAERCATCHGADATGNGPAAPALKIAPPDLTKIKKRAGGTFPAARVVEIIMFGGNVAAHGSGPMPVWGSVFSDEGGRGKIGAARSRQAIIALKRYLESIQK